MNKQDKDMNKQEYIQPTAQLIKLDAPIMQDFQSGWNTDGEHQGEVKDDDGNLGWGEND